MRHKIILSKGKRDLERLTYDWYGDQRGWLQRRQGFWRHLTKAKENKGSIRTTEVGEDSTKKWSQEGSDKRLRPERREEREEAMIKHRRPV